MTEAGWYPDPEDSTKARLWDGNAWTEERKPLPAASPPPPTGSPIEPISTLISSKPRRRPTLLMWLLGLLVAALVLVLLVTQTDYFDASKAEKALGISPSTSSSEPVQGQEEWPPAEVDAAYKVALTDVDNWRTGVNPARKMGLPESETGPKILPPYMSSGEWSTRVLMGGQGLQQALTDFPVSTKSVISADSLRQVAEAQIVLGELLKAYSDAIGEQCQTVNRPPQMDADSCAVDTYVKKYLFPIAEADGRLKNAIMQVRDQARQQPSQSPMG